MKFQRKHYYLLTTIQICGILYTSIYCPATSNSYHKVSFLFYGNMSIEHAHTIHIYGQGHQIYNSSAYIYADIDENELMPPSYYASERKFRSVYCRLFNDPLVLIPKEQMVLSASLPLCSRLLPEKHCVIYIIQLLLNNNIIKSVKYITLFLTLFLKSFCTAFNSLYEQNEGAWGEIRACYYLDKRNVHLCISHLIYVHRIRMHSFKCLCVFLFAIVISKYSYS